jgi:hypothetical protein
MKLPPFAWALCLAILAISCNGGLNGLVKSPTPVTASTVVTPDRGSLVFSDDFNDPASGWSTVTVADFRASFTASGYVIVARNFIDHEVAAPYGIPKDQMSVSVTATESSGSPSGSGFGADCDRGHKNPSPTSPTRSATYPAWVGWAASWSAGEDSGPTTVTATHFEERDLTL